MNKTIAVLEGDGVGPEIMPAAVGALEAVAARCGHAFAFRHAPVGGRAIDETGWPLPDETLRVADSSDAVLLGAVGGPAWEGLAHERRPERALLGLRARLGLFANLRPARLHAALAGASTLKRDVIEGADILVVRELTGGIYFGTPRGVEATPTGHRGFNTEVYTTEEITRIARVAFEAARARRRRVTSVDKANVLESSALWRTVVTDTHDRYRDVDLRHMYVDNCAMQLIRDPRQFDVILTTNMFGDILSDAAAMLTGSIGMLPSASVGDAAGMYEPIHGSAPDIAGRDCANPIGMIASAAMLLRHAFDLAHEAELIERAVRAVLDAGCRTGDIAGPGDTVIGTREMGDRILERLAA